MTSKERLLAAIRHQIPDRVPVSTYEMTGWHWDPRDAFWAEDTPESYIDREITNSYLNGWWNKEPSYQPLMEYLRREADCIYMTNVPMVNRYVSEHTHIEQWREGKSTYTRTVLDTPRGPLTTMWRVDADVKTAWQIEHPLKDDEDIERYLSVPFDPAPVDASHVVAQQEFLGDNGIVMVDISDPICEVFSQFDFGEFTVRGFTEPETIERMLDFTFERQAWFLQQMLEQGAGPLFRFSGPEVCTPPYLQREHFHRFVTNYDKKLIRMVHDHGQYARVHSHGRVKTVLEEFLEMEADAIDPVESGEYGDGDVEMDEAKRLTGGRICLFGNVQLKDLEQLPAAQMEEKVKRLVESAMPGGNFVLLPTSTPLNIPLSPRTEENFRIMVETAHRWGVY